MKLSISNIAWNPKDQELIYAHMLNYGFTGLEVAPTCIVSEKPYDHIEEALQWYSRIEGEYGFVISSLQSMWYGIDKKICSSPEDRSFLVDYTEKCINFAAALTCPNIVFGCPRNRNINSAEDMGILAAFFYDIARKAYARKIIIALEPNPEIYGTNVFNTTADALEFVKEVNHPGLQINLDLGTLICDETSLDVVAKNMDRIHHIHYSEPFLVPLVKRELHTEIFDLLKAQSYNGFVSIEMKQPENISEVIEAMRYVGELV